MNALSESLSRDISLPICASYIALHTPSTLLQTSQPALFFQVELFSSSSLSDSLNLYAEINASYIAFHPF